MLDQLETERTSLLFEFPIKYARVDMRYYQEKDTSKTTFIKFMSDYCKSQNITLCARYVNSKEQRQWVFANGIKYIEAAAAKNDDVSTYGISNPASAPWMYGDSKDAFANKALVSLRIPLISVDTNEQYTHLVGQKGIPI